VNELRRKRTVAVQNIYESFLAEGRKPRLLLAYWPDTPFDEAFEGMLHDPQLTDEDRQALRESWGLLAKIEQEARANPLFGVVIVFFEGDRLPGIVPVPAEAEKLIQLP